MENKKIIIITIVLFLLAGTGTFVFASNQGNFDEDSIDYRQDKEPTYNRVENNNNSNSNSNNSSEGNTTPIPNPGITEDPILPDNNGTNSSTNTTKPGNANNSTNNSNNKPNNSGTSTNKPNNSGTSNQGTSGNGNGDSNSNKPSEEPIQPVEPEIPVVKDTTPPTLKIKYNTTDATKGPVIVTIISNEPIKALTDWSLSNDKLSITKAFSNNTSGSVIVYDEANNASTIDYSIQNIDNIVPKATVETSNNNGNKLTFRDITVTITADKDIKPVAGWDLKDNRILTKTFSNIANAEYSVKIYDLVGNEAEVKYEIKNYDPTSPEVVVDKTETETTITMVYKEPLDDTWIQNENGEYVKTEIMPNNNDETIVITMPDGTIKVFESAPKIVVKVSNENPDGTTNKTNQPVKVEINSNKELQEFDGWTLSEDKKTLFKMEYIRKANEEVTIYDLSGNSTTIRYSVSNVDTIPPTIRPNSTGAVASKPSNGEVTITLRITEPSELLDSSWTNKSGVMFIKKFKESDILKGIKEQITLKDSFENITIELLTIESINGKIIVSHEIIN